MADQVTAGRFVGRTQELAWLRQLLARAAAGTPLLALVGGEAGVGKTRLVEQFVPAAEEQGARVLGGGCVPLGERACRSRRSCKRLKEVAALCRYRPPRGGS
jgi:AAA ATPase domain